MQVGATRRAATAGGRRAAQLHEEVFMPAPRKVLFISADQWRGECLSAAGHPVVRTPHLDALAADGVLFRRHFTVTSPCGPSRSSLQTGLYLMNHRSGRNGTPLDRRHTNIAREVRKIGLDPMLFGYTRVAWIRRTRRCAPSKARCPVTASACCSPTTWPPG
jgi:hypothetical protein